MAKLLMSMTYNGCVEHIIDDQITVVYETENDIVEHQYLRDQFVNAPKEGDKVTIQVMLRVVDVIPTPDGDELIDLRSHRKNVIKGPHTF